MPIFTISLTHCFNAHQAVLLEQYSYLKPAEVKQLLLSVYRAHGYDDANESQQGGLASVVKILDEKRHLSVERLFRILASLGLQSSVQSREFVTKPHEAAPAEAAQVFTLTPEALEAALQPVFDVQLNGRQHKESRKQARSALKTLLFKTDNPASGAQSRQFEQENIVKALNEINMEAAASIALVDSIIKASKPDIVSQQPMPHSVPTSVLSSGAPVTMADAYRDIVESEREEQTKVQQIVARVLTSKQLGLDDVKRFLLLQSVGDACFVCHPASVSLLQQEFKYAHALSDLLNSVSSAITFFPEAFQAELKAEISGLFTQPMAVTTLLTRLDRALLSQYSHRLFGVMKDMLKPALLQLGQSLKEGIKVIDRNQAEAGFPTTGDYSEAVHHARLAEMSRRISPFYNSQQVSLLMSLLSYMKFDNPGDKNQETVSNLLLDLLSSPGVTLSALLKSTDYKHESLLKQQGYGVQVKAAVGDAEKAARENGNSGWASMFSLLGKSVRDSRLLDCLNRYRACEEAVTRFADDKAVKAVQSAIQDLLLPVANEYHLDSWNEEKLQRRIKFTAATPQATALSV